MNDVTALIPFKRGGREDWLKQAIGSLPAGVPYLVLENDNELAEALNEGLRAAATEYVIRIDADDMMLDTDSFELLHAAMWDTDVAYPGYILVTEDLKPMADRPPEEPCGNRLRVENYVLGAGTMFRREAALEVGGYREFPALEDWDLWLRMWDAGKRFKLVWNARYVYRDRPDSRNKLPRELHEQTKELIRGPEPPLEATWYVQEAHPTAMLRAVWPAKYLPGQVVRNFKIEESGVEGEWFSYRDHRGPSAIWQFPGHDYEAVCMAEMQTRGIKVLVETDDNYLIPAPTVRLWVSELYDPTPNNRPSYEKHRRIVKWVDGLLVTTEHLAKQYRKAVDAPVFVCPNQVEPSEWPGRPLRYPEWYDPETFYVGWAGSASHLPDLKLVRQALEWAGTRPGVEVIVLGVGENGPRSWLDSLPAKCRVRWIPYATDMGVYRSLMALFDVALAPVVETPWAACRSDVKALEYAMSGAVPVLSEATPYVGWRDGEFCRKAKTARDFLRATQELVNDQKGARELALEAKQHVLEQRTFERNIHYWQEALSAIRV